MQFFEINNIEKKNKKTYITITIFIFYFFILYSVQKKIYTTTIDYSNTIIDNFIKGNKKE